MLVRCPTGSAIKLDAIQAAVQEAIGKRDYDIQSFPVELQDRQDLDVNAEPEGREQTLTYARERIKQLCMKHGPTPGIDISVESGIIDGLDVACVVIRTENGKETVAWSEGVTVPEDVFEEARKRGLKTTTVGDVIHEKHPEIPAKSWQEHYAPFISRQQQIQASVVSALRQLSATEQSKPSPA
jgi:non-canonical (house-cleaning) NTP pyrophosphatase